MDTRQPRLMDPRTPARTPYNQRLEHYGECEAALQELFLDALKTQPDTAFQEFLEFAQHFSGLSIYNAMLLRIQRPGAVAVASTSKWASIGRYPKPGVTPLVLLQPFGPVRFVYEMADTEGVEIDGERANTLFAQGHPNLATYQKMASSAGASLVRVSEVARGLHSAGFAQQGHRIEARWLSGGTKKEPHWEVVLNSNLDGPSKFATLGPRAGAYLLWPFGSTPDLCLARALHAHSRV